MRRSHDRRETPAGQFNAPPDFRETFNRILNFTPKKRSPTTRCHRGPFQHPKKSKAATGFEPVIKALQALALPLGYAAGRCEIARDLSACQRPIWDLGEDI